MVQDEVRNLEEEGRRAKSIELATQGEKVFSGHCPDPPPSTALLCELACPGDCVVCAWSTWSSCSMSCSTKTSVGRQSRSRTILAYPGEAGKPCPAAPALEDWRPCNDQPCIVFYWEALSWGPCIEDSSNSLNRTILGNGTSSCAVGVQNRNVVCIKMNVGHVINKRCLDSARPDGIRPCLLPCRTDCIVTPFSEWTTCPVSCLPAKTTAPTQSRYRTVIQRSAYGGQECPDTLYEERDCESMPPCPSYRWQTHRWQLCTLMPASLHQGMEGPGESCGEGLETRGLSCVGEEEEQVDMVFCLQRGVYMPPRTRPCRVPCKDDCTFTSWSQFSECSGCGSLRSRNRSLTGRSKTRVRCLRKDLHPLLETEACPCDDFLSQPVGNWSSCILPLTPGSPQGWRQTGPREQKECGRGRRYQAVACVDWQGQLVRPSFCSASGYLVETCQVPCPLDCKLSEWSSWSPCSASCGGGLKIRSKWLKEKAFNGGRPCPKLDLKNQVYEAVPCRSACRQSQWLVGSWSGCSINTVNELPGCGDGLQRRTVRCVWHSASGHRSTEDQVVSRDSSEDPVDSLDSSLCNQEEPMPIRAQTCYLPCPDDCVMSPWSLWSSCPLSCDPSTFRRRSRHVVRLPSSRGSCPEQLQTEICVLNSNCFSFQYNVSVAVTSSAVGEVPRAGICLGARSSPFPPLLLAFSHSPAPQQCAQKPARALSPLLMPTLYRLPRHPH
ncbi:hypothetical protein UPYG_G00160800 [Umbra pygmaea]|uniref:Spondin-like TSP1 domain-containing protein n=1 Tax=Umbra pygmaea TaxID=75934 RepID=A0ABD0WZ78_UMBPY